MSADSEADGEGAGGGTPPTVATDNVGELVRVLIADRRARTKNSLGNGRGMRSS